MKKILTLIFVFFTGYSYAQQTVSIRVINEETQEPIPYATIMYVQQNFGFSTNGNGLFRLKAREVEYSRKIQISSIGYKPYVSTVGELIKSGADTIALTPQIVLLEEVQIRAKRESAYDLVVTAANKLKDFLGKDPYYISAFYNETLQKNGNYIGFTQAQGIMQIAGYEPSFNRQNALFAYDLAQWKHIRRSEYAVNEICDPDKKRSLAFTRLTKAKSEYLYNGPLNKHNYNDYNFTLDSITTFLATDVFLVSFVPKEDFDKLSGRIFIKADDYAILRMEVEDPDFSRVTKNNCVDILERTRFSIEFRKVGDRYQIYLINLNYAYNKDNDRFVEKSAFRSGELYVNETQPLNYNQRAILFHEMANPLMHYDPQFWEENNLKIEEEVIADLGGKKQLKKGFKLNDNKRIIALPENFNSYEALYEDRDIFRLFVNDEF